MSRILYKACFIFTLVATAAQLSQECSDEALLQLSTEIAEYNNYKYRLGLSDAEIKGIDQNPTFSSVSGKFYAVLKKWKSKSVDFENPLNSTATYCRLVDIAKQLKDGTAFRSIHTACVKHVRFYNYCTNLAHLHGMSIWTTV